MTLLALEISSLSPDPYIPILHQTLATNLDSANLCIVLFLSEELKRNLDSSSKRAGHFSQLQEFVSRLYVASAVKVDVICDLVFGDWCGYLLEEEVWDYSILSLPECIPPPGMRVGGMKANNCSGAGVGFEVTTVHEVG